MKTSAQGYSTGALFSTELEMSGTLVDNAHAAVRQLDAEGHTVPVLVMDVETDGPLRNHAHIEQPFPTGEHAQCQAAARRYRRGTRITWQAPAVGVRLVVTNVSHIHVHNPQEKPC